MVALVKVAVDGGDVGFGAAVRARGWDRFNRHPAMVVYSTTINMLQESRWGSKLCLCPSRFGHEFDLSGIFRFAVRDT